MQIWLNVRMQNVVKVQNVLISFFAYNQIRSDVMVRFVPRLKNVFFFWQSKLSCYSCSRSTKNNEKWASTFSENDHYNQLTAFKTKLLSEMLQSLISLQTNMNSWNAKWFIFARKIEVKVLANLRECKEEKNKACKLTLLHRKIWNDSFLKKQIWDCLRICVSAKIKCKIWKWFIFGKSRREDDDEFAWVQGWNVRLKMVHFWKN